MYSKNQGNSVKGRFLPDFFVYRAGYNSINYIGDFVATFKFVIWMLKRNSHYLFNDKDNRL